MEFLVSDCKRGWSLEIKQSCQEIVRNEVEYNVRCLTTSFFADCSHRHFAILRSWRLRLLRRGIISLSLLSPAHSYDYYFKLDAYTPVSFVLDALDTTVVFKIERRDRFWSGARIPLNRPKKDTCTQLNHIVYIADYV